MLQQSYTKFMPVTHQCRGKASGGVKPSPTTGCRSHDSNFYRAMHFSAKRGIAIACRLSVCLSVRL